MSSRAPRSLRPLHVSSHGFGAFGTQIAELVTNCCELRTLCQKDDGKGKKGENDYQKGKGQDTKGKGKKGNSNRKETTVIARAKVRAKTRKEKVWQHVTLVRSPDILLETVGETIYDRLQVIQPVHPSSGGASVTTRTVGQQQANVSQRSSSADTKPVVRSQKDWEQ